MIKAGKLRKWMLLQQYYPASAPQNPYGAPTETWTDVVYLWAAVEPLIGREYFEAQRVNAETTHRVTIRYRDLVNTKMRFILETRIFEILSIMNPEERNLELICMCKEIV